MSEYDNMTTYKAHFTHGVDDMMSENPWFSNEYTWEPIWSPGFKDVTKEMYEADPQAYVKRVQEYNENKIKQLKADGLYLKPYIINVSMMHNPEYDDPKVEFKGGLESYRMVFLDNEEHDNRRS